MADPPPSPTRVSATDAGALLDCLERAGVAAVVAGGWGIDALVGRQTRTHRDLDVIIPIATTIRAFTALQAEGFRVVTDRFPTRFEMTDERGRAIDVHPVRFAGDGTALLESQDGAPRRFEPGDLAAIGEIAGRSVRCLTVDKQIDVHLGYEPTQRDRDDMAVLGIRFGIDPPAPY